MSRENKMRIEEELRRYEEKGERPMNQFARPNHPNEDSLKLIRTQTEALMVGGHAKDSAMRDVELMCGRMNVEFHPLASKIVDEVYAPGYGVEVVTDDVGDVVTDATLEDVNAPVQIGEQASGERQYQNGDGGGEDAEAGSGDSDGDTEEGAGEVDEQVNESIEPGPAEVSAVKTRAKKK